MATIFDVAQLAGVSIKTVSRVVNREPNIRPETIEKVNKAIEKLAYEPHRGARLMRSAKSGLIGIMTGLFSADDQSPTTAGLSDVHLLRGANRACREAGKTPLMADIGGDPEAISGLLATFTSHRVEGVIYVAPYHQQVALPKPRGTPLVLANCFDASDTPAVLPDDALGQARAVEHLARLGHRRIAYVGLHEDMVAGRLRKAAFSEACARLGLAASDCPARVGATTDRLDPFAPLPKVLDELLQQPTRPTALCVGSDVMAVHAIRHLESRGLRLPQDMALMGFDNDPVLCDNVRPRLSTVVLPYERMGSEAVSLLLAMIDGRSDEVARRVLVAGDVIDRESATPPRA